MKVRGVVERVDLESRSFEAAEPVKRYSSIFNGSRYILADSFETRSVRLQTDDGIAEIYIEGVVEGLPKEGDTIIATVSAGTLVVQSLYNETTGRWMNFKRSLPAWIIRVPFLLKLIAAGIIIILFFL